MRIIRQELIKIKNRPYGRGNGFSHVAKTEGSLWQWIIANIVSVRWVNFTYYLHSTGIDTAVGILILAAECMNTAIERVVDDAAEQRPAAKHAKDGSAAVAITVNCNWCLGCGYF